MEDLPIVIITDGNLRGDHKKRFLLKQHPLPPKTSDTIKMAFIYPSRDSSAASTSEYHSAFALVGAGIGVLRRVIRQVWGKKSHPSQISEATLDIYKRCTLTRKNPKFA